MDEDSIVYTQVRNCNWLQALEGDIDTVHFSWLHAGHIEPEDAVGDFMRYQVAERSPTLSVVDTDWGTSYATFSSANETENHCRMASFLMPCYTMVPQGVVMAKRRVGALGTDGRRSRHLVQHGCPAARSRRRQYDPRRCLAGRTHGRRS